MKESYAMWKDRTIVERALDISLAAYSLQTSELVTLRNQEVGRQLFVNPGELLSIEYLLIKDLEQK